MSKITLMLGIIYDRFLKYLRFIIIKQYKNVIMDGFVFIDKKVRLIVSGEGRIFLGKNVHLKEKTIIFVKPGGVCSLGEETSTGHHTEISCANSIKIGSNVIMGAYTYITDQDHNFDSKDIPIKMQGMKTGKVEICDDVWLGRGVYILRDSEIGSRTVIGANAVVTKKFENNSLLIGCPARKIRSI
jgi:acetyltransferase-like isoleucine patch superfamily enzyme